METNKINRKIAEWLGLKFIGKPYELEIYEGPKSYYRYTTKLDFLHDRDQQKWIEDELEKRGYYIFYEYDKLRKNWYVEIGKDYSSIGSICKRNVSRDQSFIEAVLELIEKECHNTECTKNDEL